MRFDVDVRIRMILLQVASRPTMTLPPAPDSVPAPPSQAPAKISPIRRSRLSVTLMAALIAAGASLSSVVLTWLLTERVDAEFAAQTLQLEQGRLKLAERSLELKRVNTELGEIAQRINASSLEIDGARLSLERQIAEQSRLLHDRQIEIESSRATTDEIRLTADFFRIANQLRPTIEIDCSRKNVGIDIIEANCSFRNAGAHRASITPTGVTLLSGRSQIALEGAISAFENAEKNTILSGGAGSNTYTIKLSAAGALHKGSILRLHFDSATDPIAVNMTRRMAKGKLTDDELSQLAIQTYRYNIME